MARWEHINNKRSYSHLSYSYYRFITISLSNLVLFPWESHGRDGNSAFPIPIFMHFSKSQYYGNVSLYLSKQDIYLQIIACIDQ